MRVKLAPNSEYAPISGVMSIPEGHFYSMGTWPVEWLLYESYQFDSHVECSQDTGCPSAVSLHSWHPNLECRVVQGVGQNGR